MLLTTIKYPNETKKKEKERNLTIDDEELLGGKVDGSSTKKNT